MKGAQTIRKYTVLWLIWVAGLASIPFSLQAQSREYLLKAGFVEKFTQFVQWPGRQQLADTLFRIAVVGENRFGSSLDELFREVKVNRQGVIISYLPRFQESNNLRMLFISGSVSSEEADQIFLFAEGKPILTIAETKGFGKKGAIINLLVVDNFIRYEINLSALEKSGLKMSSLLINSATLIETDDK